MKALFLHISDTIAAKVAAIRWTDFDLGQLDSGQNAPVSFPCVLVSFDTANYTRFGAKLRMAEQPFRLRIAFTVRERTHSKNDPTFRDEALAHLDALEAVKNALIGTSGMAFGGIELTGQSNEQRADHRIYNLLFSCKVWEDGNDPTTGDPIYKPVEDWPGAIVPVEACVHPHMDN